MHKIKTPKNLQFENHELLTCPYKFTTIICSRMYFLNYLYVEAYKILYEKYNNIHGINFYISDFSLYLDTYGIVFNLIDEMLILLKKFKNIVFIKSNKSFYHNNAISDEYQNSILSKAYKFYSDVLSYSEDDFEEMDKYNELFMRRLNKKKVEVKFEFPLEDDPTTNYSVIKFFEYMTQYQSNISYKLKYQIFKYVNNFIKTSNKTIGDVLYILESKHDFRELKTNAKIFISFAVDEIYASNFIPIVEFEEKNPLNNITLNEIIEFINLNYGNILSINQYFSGIGIYELPFWDFKDIRLYKKLIEKINNT